MADLRTFIEEMLAAGRGIVALLVGDRKAAGWFDLSLRGLMGALIGLIGVETILSYGPALLLPGAQAGSPGADLLMSLAVAAMPVALVGAFLRFIGRWDGFVPFLVADFWASAYLTLAGVLLLLIGLPAIPVMAGLTLVVIIVEINIARLIVTLPPLQIAGLIVVQLIGGFLGLMFWGATLDMPPEMAGAVPA